MRAWSSISIQLAKMLGPAGVFVLAVIAYWIRRRSLMLAAQHAFASIRPQPIVIEYHGKNQHIHNKFVFIFAGSEMTFAFLQSLGLKIDKKFGEKAQKA